MPTQRELKAFVNAALDRSKEELIREILESGNSHYLVGRSMELLVEAQMDKKEFNRNVQLAILMLTTAVAKQNSGGVEFGLPKARKRKAVVSNEVQP